MELKKIGAFLKELRGEKGLTQEQLAEQLNVSGRTVSRWETGSNMPDLDILLLLSDYYAVDIREILDGERKRENMEKERIETLKKAADYSSLRERALLKKLILIVVAGCAAWGISFAVMLRFMDSVTVGFIVLVFSLAGVLYSAGMLCFRANRRIDGCLNCLLAAFIGLITGNILLLILFFGGGTYHNYGIIGVYYCVLTILAVFLLTGIGVTLFNKRNSDRQK